LKLLRSCHWWSEYEIDYLNKNYDKHSQKELVSVLKRPWKAIVAKAVKLELKRGSRWTKIEKERLLDYSSKSSSKEELLQDFPGRTWCSIMSKAYRCSIPHSSRHPRVEILERFYQIDSEEKAYIIGVLLADGSMSKCGYRISLGWAEQDLKELKNIQQIISPDSPIEKIERRKKNPKWQDYYVLVITDKRLYQNLTNYGLVPKKVYTTKPPGKWLPTCLTASYVRGILDGDGCIHEVKKIPEGRISRLCVNITGTKELMEFINNWFIAEANIKKGFSLIKIKNSGHAFALATAGRKARLFLKLIYGNNPTIYLQRKYALAKKYIEITHDAMGRLLD
jgi:hypothetical protein